MFIQRCMLEHCLCCLDRLKTGADLVEEGNPHPLKNRSTLCRFRCATTAAIYGAALQRRRLQALAFSSSSSVGNVPQVCRIHFA